MSFLVSCVSLVVSSDKEYESDSEHERLTTDKLKKSKGYDYGKTSPITVCVYSFFLETKKIYSLEVFYLESDESISCRAVLCLVVSCHVFRVHRFTSFFNVFLRSNIT